MESIPRIILAVKYGVFDPRGIRQMIHASVIIFLITRGNKRKWVEKR